MTDLLPRLLVTFATAAAELWVAVPAGIALGLPAAAVAAVSAAGAATGAGLVVVLGQPARDWILSRLHPTGSKGGGRLGRIWLRYGVPGLGLAAPLLVGAPIGTALGLALGAPTGRLFRWMSAGIVLWATVLTLVVVFGLAALPATPH